MERELERRISRRSVDDSETVDSLRQPSRKNYTRTRNNYKNLSTSRKKTNGG